MTVIRPQDDPAAEIVQSQQTALLRTTLARIVRYATQMQDDLTGGELNISHADQLGRSVLTVLKEAASICARIELASRSAA